MAKVTIDVWLHDEEHEETDCFIFYRFAGLCDGKPWCATVGIEIDGRDMEFEHHWGERLDNNDPDRWEAFMEALCDDEALIADQEQRAAAYYG